MGLTVVYTVVWLYRKNAFTGNCRIGDFHDLKFYDISGFLNLSYTAYNLIVFGFVFATLINGFCN